MGRRSEQRIAVSLPVIIRGLDSHGAPFTVTAETYDISFSGASLKGLTGSAAPGMKVEIETQGQKAWYRIQWIGKNGSSRAGRIGLRCLEHSRYIWGVAPKGWEPDTYEPSMSPEAQPSPAAAAPNSLAGHERREFARRACRIETQVTTEDDSIGASGKITDISLGGCYVEMLSPLPFDAQVQLTFNLDDAALRLSGKICSSHSGMGMGVVFTTMSTDAFEKLRRFAPPAVPPAKTASPSATAPAVHPLPLPQSLVIAPQASYSSSAADFDLADLPAPASTSSEAQVVHPPPLSQSRVAVPRASYSSSVADSDRVDLPAPAEALDAIVRLLLRKGVLTLAELSEELEKKTTKA